MRKRLMQFEINGRYQVTYVKWSWRRSCVNETEWKRIASRWSFESVHQMSVTSAGVVRPPAATFFGCAVGTKWEKKEENPFVWRQNRSSQWERTSLEGRKMRPFRTIFFDSGCETFRRHRFPIWTSQPAENHPTSSHPPAQGVHLRCQVISIFRDGRRVFGAPSGPVWRVR